MTIWLIISLILYVLVILITFAGIHRKVPAAGSEEPSVSVIVVAREEESVITDCLESLAHLNYPREKLEVILVDDRSQDLTGEIMRRFTCEHAHFKTITIREDPTHYTGKTNGLIHGVNISIGDILFFTDGDCIVPPNWIRSGLKAYNEKTGLVGGFLTLTQKGKRSPLFAQLQSLDWLYISTIGLGWSNLGMPLSIFGNNFSIRRKTYTRAGGFEKAGEHITEDFALMRLVKNETNDRVRFLLDKDHIVYTHPSRNLKAFFDQRKRWAVGCRDRGVMTLIIVSIGFLTHLALFITLLSGRLLSGAGGLLIKLAMDTLLLSASLKILKRKDIYRRIPGFEIYFMLYTILMAPALFFAREVKWKSSEYDCNNGRRKS